jgi:hypothetical protein
MKLKKFLLTKNQKSTLAEKLVIERVKVFDHGMVSLRSNIIEITDYFYQMW